MDTEQTDNGTADSSIMDDLMEFGLMPWEVNITFAWGKRRHTETFIIPLVDECIEDDEDVIVERAWYFWINYHNNYPVHRMIASLFENDLGFSVNSFRKIDEFKDEQQREKALMSYESLASGMRAAFEEFCNANKEQK